MGRVMYDDGLPLDRAKPAKVSRGVGYTDFLNTFPLVAKEGHDVRIPVLVSLFAGFAEGTFVPESNSLVAPDRRVVEIEDFQTEAV